MNTKYLKYIIGILIGIVSIPLFTQSATVLFPSGGGTGTSTAPTYGQVLLGNINGRYDLVATSSLGITQDLSGYVPYTGATSDVNIGTHTYIGHSIKGDASDGLLIESNNGTDIGLLGAGNTANVTWYGNHNFNGINKRLLAHRLNDSGCAQY